MNWAAIAADANAIEAHLVEGVQKVAAFMLQFKSLAAEIPGEAGIILSESETVAQTLFEVTSSLSAAVASVKPTPAQPVAAVPAPVLVPGN